jgi:hypothetical protein
MKTMRRMAHSCFPRKLHAGGTTVFLLALASMSAAQESRVWRQINVAGPSPRGEFGFAYDSARHQAVLLGGSNTLDFTGVNSETWGWDGVAWTLLSSVGLTARCDNAMAFDSVRDVVVSFAGYNGNYLADTLHWNGTQWTDQNVTGPGARADSFMAFDSKRGVMVLFGGQSSAGFILRDTWEWNGTTWTQVATTGPLPRWIHRMAFDSQRGVTVMFGGAHPGGLRGDTWEWDGATWVNKTPPAGSPSPRYGHSMAYDSHRGVTILYGGQTGFGFGVNPVGDTWEWDGTNWRQLDITGPPARSFVKMVYDKDRRKCVVFGGYDGSQFLGDTWELEVAVPTLGGTALAILAALLVFAGVFLLKKRNALALAM